MSKRQTDPFKHRFPLYFASYRTDPGLEDQIADHAGSEKRLIEEPDWCLSVVDAELPDGRVVDVAVTHDPEWLDWFYVTEQEWEELVGPDRLRTSPYRPEVHGG